MREVRWIDSDTARIGRSLVLVSKEAATQKCAALDERYPRRAHYHVGNVTGWRAAAIRFVEAGVTLLIAAVQPRREAGMPPGQEIEVYTGDVILFAGDYPNGRAVGIGDPVRIVYRQNGDQGLVVLNSLWVPDDNADRLLTRAMQSDEMVVIKIWRGGAIRGKLIAAKIGEIAENAPDNHTGAYPRRMANVTIAVTGEPVP